MEPALACIVSLLWFAAIFFVIWVCLGGMKRFGKKNPWDLVNQADADRAEIEMFMLAVLLDDHHDNHIL